MNELIEQLKQKAGLSDEQASKAIDAIKEFVIEKFPMMAGAVENLFASQNQSTEPDTSAPPIPSPSMMDKTSEFILGETGGKI